jgi:4-amino-4-deoxy-L-arabinose transferase-like glycosyltransferase
MKNQGVRKLLTQLILVLVGCVLFLPGLGSVHLFDWDEINFAESAREMLLTGDYLTVQVNFEPFWEKPPLFIWMQALSMHLFGVNEFAARLPNVLCGIITLLTLFNCGYRLKGYRFGLLWSMLYACSLFPFFYFKTGIIDPWFNLFIFGGVYCFMRFTAPEHRGNAVWQVALSALFLGLAILTKGPVGLLIFLLTFAVYLLVNRFKLRFTWMQVLLFMVITAGVGGLWFILQIIAGNYAVVQDFIAYQIRLFQTQDAGHGGFFLYHFVMILIGVFPASLLALPVFHRSVLRDEENRNTAHMFRWMMILFGVVLILFTIVKTKIVHYASMSYFPLTFMAAWYVNRCIAGKERIFVWQKILILTFAAIYGLAVALLPSFDRLKVHIIPYLDEFTAGNLQAVSQWHGFEPLIGCMLILTTTLFCIWVKRTGRAVAVLLLGAVLFVSSTMFFVVPEVEKYTQVSMIEFLELRRGEDCYIYPIHKSYAHYFYADRQRENRLADSAILMRGQLDKPCYFILRHTRVEVENFEKDAPDAKFLYAENGFAFYVRIPNTY